MRSKITIITCLIAILVSTPVFSKEKKHTPPLTPLFQTGTIGGHDMIAVKGGCYQMGSDSGAADEQPVHEVCVDDFYIGRYEVTQGQWLKLKENNPSYFLIISSLNGKKKPLHQGLC